VDSAYVHIGAVKAVLYSVSIKGECPDYPDPLTTMREGGSVLGELVKTILPVDRVFVESFVSNLMVEFPSQEGREEGRGTMGNLAIVLGNIAVTVRDEAVAKICLSSLLMQFNKISPADTEAREHFLSQFALLASSCSGAIFNGALDLLASLIRAGTHPHQTLSCLDNLSQLIAGDSIKRDVLLVTLMRSFVDRGIAIISIGDKASSAKLAADNDCNSDVNMLLKAICTSMETFPPGELANKTVYVDVFQEFWMILVVLGYQAELRWREELVQLIPIIAMSTPVLVKERDKLQSMAGSTFSQVVLSQSSNPALRNHLSSLLPNSPSNLLKSITFAQCLWLISIYWAELHKLRLGGRFEHFGAYLQSDVIELLGIYPLVEDLVFTIISHWKDHATGETTIAIADQETHLARQLMGLLCHIQPRTHQTALKLLQKHFLRSFAVYCDGHIWQVIAVKLASMFFVCRAALGAPELEIIPEELTRDPTAAQTAFRDLVDVCRDVYSRAADSVPNAFFKFAHSKIYSKVDSTAGDRDVALLELLRIVFPSDRLDEKADVYLNSDALLFRNAENFVHYETNPLPVGENMPAQVLELLTDLTLPLRVRKGVRQWLAFTDRNPMMPVRLLSGLSFILANKLKALYIQIPDYVEPLRAKFTATPSKDINRSEESNIIAGVAVLLAFLSEQLHYDCIRSPDALPMYASLVVRLLNVIRWCPRFIALRIITFAFDVMDATTDPELLPTLLQTIYATLLDLMIRLPLLMVAPQQCSSEELLIMRELADILVREARGDRSTIGRRRRAVLASAILVLLQTHAQETLVWMGMESREKPLSVPDSKKEIISGTLGISVGLVHRLIEHCKIGNEFNLQLNGLEVCTDSSDLVTYAINNMLMMPTDAWIYAAPLTLPVAISVFRSTVFKEQPLALNLSLRSLETAPADVLYYYIPQLVQSLRHSTLGFVERSVLHIAKESALFAHQVIWNMRANAYLDEAALQPDPLKPALDELIARITGQFTEEDANFYHREFSFFEKITAISGALKPYVKKEKWEKKAKIDEELAKIAVDAGVYLPSSPESVVVDVDYDSGRPLQSHAKAPFLATFRVQPAHGKGPAVWQSAIFKVGDDCRQDVLALQLIALAKHLFERHNLPVYLYPYRVVATAPGCGVIEVIPKSISRDQLGREKINSLYEYFVFRFGGASSRAFHAARINFVRSMAAYSVLCYVIAIKDRHNGNIMVDDSGHIIHIDFGFILDIAPGGITFENAPFKLTSEMLQVMGGKEESPYFRWFRELCVQTFMVLRCNAESFIQLVATMADSGLPCFRGEKTIRNLRNRFRLDLDAMGVRAHVYDLVHKSCENVRTVMYDRYQLSTCGIPY
jgi:hypothetical protein